ncbi:ABC transporter permease [Brachybacterium sacelli]|uniref:Peptide/nickel transport system permease protein n=1 Tax=Brachybacterium sacelli TaxID=173364 RepID=A0ABS4WYK9_9MICO|nr:ABC transporter permease [Brachybacterium sacelli]MBP2381292.1 peptide/nickel transport system permease protein [Brachybacterium sacelli]
MSRTRTRTPTSRHRRSWVSRLGQYALVLWVAVTVNFALPRLALGGPALVMYTGEGDPTAEQLAELGQLYGLDDPVLVQYGRFWAELLRGDLGLSTGHNRPVADVLLERLPWSVVLVVLGLVGAILVGALLGALAAWRRDAGHPDQDRALLVTVLALDAMPGFWIAMLLIAVFAAQLGWLPSYASAQLPDGGGAWLLESARRLVMPLATMIVTSIGTYFLLARASMSTVLAEPFLRLARAKGLPERVVATRHALRTALLPIVTNAAMAAGSLVSGAVVVETVFSYPGLGTVIADAVAERDYPLLQGAFLLAMLGVILANLLADLVYPLLDPRVRRTAEVVPA